jgi:hypothetical protein
MKLSTPTSLSPCRCCVSMSTMDATRGWDPQRAVAAGKGTTRAKPRRNRAATKPGITAGIGTSTCLTEFDPIPSQWRHHLGRPAARWPSADIVLCWPRVERQVAQFPRLQHLFFRKKEPQLKRRDKVCGQWKMSTSPPFREKRVTPTWSPYGNGMAISNKLIQGKRQSTQLTTTQLPEQGSQAVVASKSAVPLQYCVRDSTTSAKLTASQNPLVLRSRPVCQPADAVSSPQKREKGGARK